MVPMLRLCLACMSHLRPMTGSILAGMHMTWWRLMQGAGPWSLAGRCPQGTGLPDSIATGKCSDWGSCSALQALQLQLRLQLPPLDIRTVLCAPSLTGLETRSSPAEAACPEVSLGVSFTRVP